MKNWQRDRNYRKYENADGTVRYVITIDGIDTDVSEKVYKAYSQEDRRERYQAERDAGRLLSLDGMNDNDGLLTYLADGSTESAEETALRKMHIEQALAALSLLEEGEQGLIQTVVMDGVTEQDYADLIGVSQVAVHKRKKRILKKLFDLMVIKASDFREGK